MGLAGRLHKVNHYFRCQKQVTTYGIRCIDVSGRSMDAAVTNIVLAILEAPPIEDLQQALRTTRAAEEANEGRVQAALGRLRSEEQRARERFNLCDPTNRFAWTYAQEQLEKTMQQRILLEQRIASEPPRPPSTGTDAELRELCEIASNVPALWESPVVTNQERKQILGCLITKIDVDVAADAVEATIDWASGAQTSFRVWSRLSLQRFILEHHAAGLSVPKIRLSLAEMTRDTGQFLTVTKGRIYELLKRNGLKPHPAKRRVSR